MWAKTIRTERPTAWGELQRLGSGGNSHPMTVYNHLLFSEIFFQQIRQETTDLDNLRATLSTIRATWQYYLPPPPGWDGPTWDPSSPFPPDDVAQLRINVVEQIFAYLELTYGPCEGDGSTAPALSGAERVNMVLPDIDQRL